MFLGLDPKKKKEQVLEMLEKTLTEVYTKFKIHFYQEIFHNIEERETSLTAAEIFSVEIIHALNEPTVAEFANFINVSSPNAAYKINSLIKKGYIEKIQSKEDRREYHLKVTDKYFSYYNLSQGYVDNVIERAKKHFSAEQLEVLDQMLGDMSNELMSDVEIHIQ